jgi:DedD protein
MATRTDGSEVAVDELRRRARRRLVGAIVLALAAAVLLPLLLENEPKPLGDDVSIQIPPIDNGKFVNPLSPGKPPDPKIRSDARTSSNAPAVSAPAQAGQPPGGSDGASAEPATPSGSSPTPAAAAPATQPPAPPAKASEPATVAPDAKVGAGSESKPESRAATAASVDAKSDPQKSGAFVVQVAAFSDHYGARSLVVKLKRGGFSGYTEAVATDKGTLHRVRVGPYSSREAADAALAKLKAAGFNGMVTRNG